MTPATLVTFAAGLAILVAGAELLVRGASRIAVRTGVSPVVIGLTVVAFGTSAPELAVSANAALRGAPDITLGNVVGSNMVNLLLVLGLAAVVGGRLDVARRLVRVDLPVLVVASASVWVLALDGTISRPEGAGLVIAIVFYAAWTISTAGNGGHPTAPTASGRWPINAAAVLIGLVMLALGANWLVDAATTLAVDLGVGDLVIGLTVVAIGTAGPELATSMVATVRGQRDLAVGNVIGASIINLLLVLGLSSTLARHGLAVLDDAARFDLPVLTAATAACLVICLTGRRISRGEGVVLIVGYTAYLGYRVLR